MPRQRIWLSYDLGVQGDYEGLYAWLDEHKATECGDSVATLMFSFKRDLPVELQDQLQERVRFGPHSRVYLLFGTGPKEFGWLLGRARRPPWEGYAPPEVAGESSFGWEPPPPNRTRKGR